MPTNPVLTPKQARFVDAYLATWSQIEAARQAGYSSPEKCAWAIIRRPLVAAAIKERMSTLAMEADEVLLRLGQQGKASIAMFFTFTSEVDENDELQRKAEINWAAVEKYGFLIKRIELTKDGWRLELHDTQKALELIGKHLKLFTDQLAVSDPKGNPLFPEGMIRIVVHDNGAA